jgi:hypothetical protein
MDITGFVTELLLFVEFLKWAQKGQKIWGVAIG